MIRIAALTAIAAFGEDQDLPPLRAALGRYGIAVEELAWDDPTVSWGRFRAVLLRSPWDYSERHQAFFAFLEGLAQRLPLLNPYPVLRWNLDKRYLRELEAEGVAIVPTRFIEVPGDWPESLAGSAEWVIKPAIGAGSRGARRFPAGRAGEAREHANALLASGRGVLLQPYIANVEERGETALVYFAGRLSHAIRKQALLAADGAAVRALYNPERIAPHRPEPAERRAGERVLRVLARRFAAHWPLPYARIDLLPAAGGPRLLEVELAEPSLFLAYGRGAAARFARAIAAALGAAGERRRRPAD